LGWTSGATGATTVTMASGQSAAASNFCKIGIYSSSATGAVGSTLIAYSSNATGAASGTSMPSTANTFFDVTLTQTAVLSANSRYFIAVVVSPSTGYTMFGGPNTLGNTAGIVGGSYNTTNQYTNGLPSTVPSVGGDTNRFWARLR